MFRPWPPSGFAVHDLARLATLSDVPGLALFLSPRTLYVLQNLAAAEATWQSRYARELADNGYFPVEVTDATYDLFLSVIDGIRLEVLEMPDVVDLLTDIKDMLGAGIAVRNHGWFNSEWREDTLRLGYNGLAGGAVQDLDASAGPNTLFTGYPSAGEVWVLEGISGLDVNNSPGNVLLFVEIDGQWTILREGTAAPAGAWTAWTGQITLTEDERAGAYFPNCTLGDDIHMRYLFRKAARA